MGRRTFGVIVGLAVLAGAMAPAAQASGREIAHAGKPPAEIKEPPDRVLDSSCPDLSGCLWEQGSYAGGRFVAGSAYAGTWYGASGFDRSAKNRFGNRRIQFGEYQGGGNYRIVGCLNAGGSDPNLALSIDSFKIGAQGTVC